MTDLFPRIDAWEAARAEHPGDIDFVAEPVDATRIPEELGRGRARTIINAFHHFPPEVASALLADAVRGSAGVFVSESFDRNPLRFLPFAPAGLAALAANPVLARSDRLAKAALTYLTPFALGISAWDGIVSTLRVYSEADLRRDGGAARGRVRVGVRDVPVRAVREGDVFLRGAAAVAGSGRRGVVYAWEAECVLDERVYTWEVPCVHICQRRSLTAKTSSPWSASSAPSPKSTVPRK